MAYTLTDLPALRAAGFDTIIDVRSPAEFAEDRIPGAVNMPVLSNAERARVGTIYTQDSPFAARKIGAALVARNAAAHIEAHMMAHDGGWRPLVYCWRGGQRSGSFASILQQIGWRAETVVGGYQSWRRHVVARLYDARLPHRVIRLDGFTGTAKTDILARVGALGGQVIDLEGLANHRGSILGDRPGGQPAQKGFETALLTEIEALDPARPVLLEAESARIGELRLPPALWAAMKNSPRIVIEAPAPERARYLARAYADLRADTHGLTVKLDGLRALAGHAEVDRWHALLAEGRTEAMVEALIAAHYDPAYARARKATEGTLIATLPLAHLDAASLDRAAAEIATHL